MYLIDRKYGMKGTPVEEDLSSLGHSGNYKNFISMNFI